MSVGPKHHEHKEKHFVDDAEFDRLHLDRHSTGREARWTPVWAADDSKVRLVVYSYLYNGVRQSRVKPGISIRELNELVAKQKFWKLEIGPAAFYTGLIYRAYRLGLRSSDIAHEFGLTTGSVRQRLTRCNTIARKLFPNACFAPHWSNGKRTKPRKVKPNGKPITAELLLAAEMYNNLHSLREISAKLGGSTATIYWRLKRYGLIKRSGDNRKLRPICQTQ